MPELLPSIRRSVAPDGVCVLTFDAPGSSANVLKEDVLRELGDHLSWIEKQSHHEVRALIIQSAKKNIFIAGADIEALHSLPAKTLSELLKYGQEIFNRLADISIPTVAAIHGACMGGGLELALACDYRIATDEKATSLALPETMLGILPSWGGCTRLPRLIGLPKALNLILTGKKLAARQARKLGVIHATCPQDCLLGTARTFLQNGKAHPPKHRLRNNCFTAALLRFWVRRSLLKKTRGNYPALTEALDVVTGGVSRSRDISLSLERTAVDKLITGEAAQNLIRVFLLQQRAKKLRYAPEHAPTPVKHTAVIGAGVMGAGIAHWISSRSLSVILQDIAPKPVAAGLSLISKRYLEAVERRIFTPSEAKRLENHIYPAAQPVPLQRAGIVIEAATENLDLKKRIFLDLEKRTGAQTILATNTSALPLGEIANELSHPERVIGLHFFNPVHRMQLVEIVVAETTAPAVVESTLSFVKQIGKLPVIVADRPGFLVNRVLVPYLVEAGQLFESGVSASALDEAMLDFGMPMGPIRLLDEIGLDVALDVAQTLSAAFPERMSVPAILEAMVANGDLGKKSGRGFYTYGKGESNAPRAIPANRTPDTEELRSRMVLLMINEAARCLDEKVVAEPEDADFAMIMGTGFAPFRGGPLRYADSLGITNVVASLDRFAASHGAHFTPCKRLLAMADKNTTFYSDRPVAEVGRLQTD